MSIGRPNPVTDRVMGAVALLLLVLVGQGLRSRGAADRPPSAASEYQPRIRPASDEGKLAIRDMQLSPGFRCELWAAEPLLANPVAFWPDGKGGAYVCETFRQEENGVPDNRTYPEWLQDDLAARTVEDRRAFYLKHHPEFATQFTREEDRIRHLRDDDGDGRADHAEVFAGGFRDILDGTGAGVLERDGKVYYTCIPDLWMLEDRDGDGRAETRRSLQHGFGVRVALRGHDMHGLVNGPDGRIYFSIGDRGYNLLLPDGRRLEDPGSGAVFRCEADGSGLEVFATGLRNPQELAFDDYGNLFTGDNNSDGGDQARIVNVVEGGETGWRMSFQTLGDRGPWNRENWWRPRREDTAAFLMPPLANLGSGPSGLFCDPGTGLPDRYRGWFFLCDFLGGRSHSGVRAFRLEPEGAGFRFVESHHFVKGLLPTDVDMGADGAVWVTDWVEGWVGEGKGRIYRIFDADAAGTEAARDVARLLGQRFGDLPAGELLALLGHADRRLRLKAQYALAEGREAGIDAALIALAADGARPTLPRIHAIWALDQRRRQGRAEARITVALLQDADAEVRKQAARCLGDERDATATADLIAALKDPAPRVRAAAAQALGKIGAVEAAPALFALIAENADRDLWIRHAGVMGLSGIGAVDPGALEVGRRAPERAIRLVTLLAYRRLRREEVVSFLDDADEAIAVEAARAIYDRPIPEAMAPLAALLATSSSRNEALLRRALGAADALSDAASARALAVFAADRNRPTNLRALALERLETWARPSPRDPVLGEYRPPQGRRAEDARIALAPLFPVLLADADAEIVTAAANAAREHGDPSIAPILEARVDAEGAERRSRIAALAALEGLRVPDLRDVAGRAFRSGDAELRVRAAATLASIDAAEALPLLVRSLDEGRTAERQLALLTLATLKHPEADRAIESLLGDLLADRAPPELRLEILEAARRRAKAGNPAMAKALLRWDERGEGSALLADARRVCLTGGDPRRGEKVFRESAASCLRCHSYGEKKEQAGPDLADVGKLRDRPSLLESILEPSAKIREGFSTEQVFTRDDRSVIGRILEEDAQSLVVEVNDYGSLTPVRVAKSEIVERRGGRSAMPDDVTKSLSLKDLRDLVEFLSSLVGDGKR